MVIPRRRKYGSNAYHVEHCVVNNYVRYAVNDSVREHNLVSQYLHLLETQFIFLIHDQFGDIRNANIADVDKNKPVAQLWSMKRYFDSHQGLVHVFITELTRSNKISQLKVVLDHALTQLVAQG